MGFFNYEYFLVFLVFFDQEIDHFSCFPTGNWKTRKCATLVAVIDENLKSILDQKIAPPYLQVGSSVS